MADNKEKYADYERKVRLFRERFVVRDDVFLKKAMTKSKLVDPDTGVVTWADKKIFPPVCANEGSQELCLIAQRRGSYADCATCTNRRWAPLTDEWVGRHILGNNAELALLVLAEKGIRVGAVDFDGDGQQTLHDIVKEAVVFRDFCRAMRVECYIARSSNKGYHLYFFFSDWIKPELFNSFISYCFDQLGYTFRLLHHGIRRPEVFPKQSVFNQKSVSNGIRVPMSEPDMRRGKNCWVDDEGNPLPFEMQWEYFANTKFNEPADFEQMLAAKEIPIIQGPVKRTRAASPGTAGHAEFDGPPPPIRQFGSFLSIIEKCPAMREYWTKDSSGAYAWDKSNPKGLFNDARVASMNIALATTDGEEILKARWPSSETEKQIVSAKSKAYRPVTCKWMQEHGVCHVGKHPRYKDHCLKKMPPLKKENGQLVPDDTPEEQWDDPSPVRYATDRHMTVEEMKEILALLCGARTNPKDPNVSVDASGRPIVEAVVNGERVEERFNSIFRRLRYMKSDEVEEIKSWLKANSLMKAKEITDRIRRAKREVDAEETAKQSNENPYFDFKNKRVFLIDDCLHAQWTDVKGETHKDKLTNFWVECVEQQVLLRLTGGVDDEDVTSVEDRWMVLNIHVNKQVYRTTLDTKEFTNDQKFMLALTKAAGADLQYQRSDFDIIRNSVMPFSSNSVTRRRAKEIGYYRFGGKEVLYLMPSVIVTSHSVVNNDRYSIQFDDEFSSGLDFRILDDREAAVAAHSVINDYFECNNQMVTMTSFAHAMSAVLMDRYRTVVSYDKSPVLWVVGEAQRGKTFSLWQCQRFFGNWPDSALITASSTNKAKLGLTRAFRHAFVVIDNVKDVVHGGTRSATEFVHAVYDRGGRAAKRRDGTLRQDTDRAQGMIAVSAEDAIENDAAAISRLIQVEADLRPNEEAGSRVLEKRHLYSGFTARFVQYVLSLPDEEIRHTWDDCYALMKGGVESDGKVEESRRVDENMTLNLASFRIVMNYITSLGVITESVRDGLVQRQATNLKLIKADTLNRIRDNRGSAVFSDLLRQVLATPTKYAIHGWEGYSQGMLDQMRSTTWLGFVKKGKNGTKDSYYLFPEAAYAAVSDFARRSNIVLQSKGHVARQLYSDNLLVVEMINRKRNRWTVQQRTSLGHMANVWPVRPELLGFDDLSSKISERENAAQPRETSGPDIDDGVTF